MSCRFFARDPLSCKHGQDCRYSHDGKVKNRRKSRSKSPALDTVLTERGWYLLPGATTTLQCLRANKVSCLIVSKCRQKMACRSLQVVSHMLEEGKISLLHTWLDNDDISLFTLFCLQRSEKALLLQKMKRTIVACLDDNPECMINVKTTKAAHLLHTRLFLVNALPHHQQEVEKNPEFTITQTWWDIAQELALIKYHETPLLTLENLHEIKHAYDIECETYLQSTYQPKEPQRGDIKAVEKLFMRGVEGDNIENNIAMYMSVISDSKYRYLFDLDGDDFPCVMVDIGNVMVSSEPARNKKKKSSSMLQ